MCSLPQKFNWYGLSFVMKTIIVWHTSPFAGANVCGTRKRGTSGNVQRYGGPMNPFFAQYDTPFGIPPFGKIESEHYLPAVRRGLKEQLEEHLAIANSSEVPTFENTIVAMERSGELLTRVLGVFYNLNSADTNEALQAISLELGPMLAAHSSALYMNTDIFARIEHIHAQRGELSLTQEQDRLLTKIRRRFLVSGVNLDEASKEKYKANASELAECLVRFGQNLLQETNTSGLTCTDVEELAGLPEDMVAGARQYAEAQGKPGSWMFKADQGTLYAFLTSSTRPDLRRAMYEAYLQRGNRGNERDNNAVLMRIAELRLDQARLMGCRNYAEFALEDTMAKTTERVRELLASVMKPALVQAQRERDRLAAMLPDGEVFSGSDWWHYAELLRKQEYDLSEATIRPYLPVDAVREGAFKVAERLFGLKFIERDDFPVYHPDVRTFEVREADGALVGLFYADYFSRPSKRGGAWMSVFRGQSAIDEHVYPIVVNVCNYPPPVGDTPSLLTTTQVRTLFHEFGHALHGLLSKATYPTLAGTAVPRDYVEFPSQIMENWGRHRDVMRGFAKHYQSAEVISEALLDKLEAAGTFNTGFRTTEYLAAAYLDLAWHTIEEMPEDPQEFERRVLSEIGLIGEIASRYRSTYFAHIFAGGYAAGYYSYLWSEVLDSDGFSLFEERGLYHPETAMNLRALVYAAGNTVDTMEQYIRFRGSSPKVDALLQKRGLVEQGG